MRITLEGELDLATAPEVEAALREPVEQERLVLDLRGLTFMDSSGLRLLMGAQTRATEDDRRLALVRGPDAVHRVLEITHMDERFEIVDDPAPLLG